MTERTLGDILRHHTAVVLSGAACVMSLGGLAHYCAEDNMGGTTEVAQMTPSAQQSAEDYIDRQTRIGVLVGMGAFLVGFGIFKGKPFEQLPEEAKQ
jgi:hypothetical protein